MLGKSGGGMKLKIGSKNWSQYYGSQKDMPSHMFLIKYYILGKSLNNAGTNLF
jgi:hypothetical protein